MNVGIACASGSFKAVFIQGVLASFEEAKMVADIYAASSSSAIPVAFAATGELGNFDGRDHIRKVYTRYIETNYNISEAIVEGIQYYLPYLKAGLFRKNSARFAVVVSEVVPDEAREITQGDGARKLGQKLVISIRKKDSSWIDQNLKLRLFDTRPDSGDSKLTINNLHEVLYATTRMLHAWKVPAWIEGKPYVDASYTCTCPAVELARLGCQHVIAISPETGTIYRDFLQTVRMPEMVNGVPIEIIQPDINLSEIGVDYLKVTDDGLRVAYDLGKQKGIEFLQLQTLKWEI